MPSLRRISCGTVRDTVERLFLEASTDLGKDVIGAIRKAASVEKAELGRFALERIIENARIAREECLPLCQDTGMAVVFLELGQNVHVTGSNLYDAVQEGVRRAYRKGHLRKSICDPLSRSNTGDNTPAVIHTEVIPGNRIGIKVMPKGGGSENMSSVNMLLPAAGTDGIRQLIVNKVREAGPNPCPPTIVGVGIGGSIEKAALLAKKALLRPLGRRNRRDKRLAKLEADTLKEINMLGIGPQGYGGASTSLAVHVEMMPCHIASLPVAVNIQCHAARHKEAVI
ncbi:MAG TPA: fumarate hydratase [Syntrophales bacterium]|nr:fumarate hydratase [Syntrophales bacterium]HPN24156.1 fumarate hydratase [Syntrophales bacterium]